MKHYTDELGYRGIGFRGLDLDTLADLNTPIIPIRIHGYNHFVVFRGISPKGQIRVADPAFGNRLFDRQKFERIWMGGIAFTITKEMT
jgi:predicted double-glycine peptidase